MQIDTGAVRRLRDRLLAVRPTHARAAETPRGAGGGLTPEQAASLERIGPLVEVLFLTMVADGAVAAPERLAIRNAVGVLTDGVLPRETLDALLGRFEAALREQGRDTRLEVIASRFALDREDAEAAFRLAAAVALSDGHIDPAERDLAEELRGYFGISRERAAALLAGPSD